MVNKINVWNKTYLCYFEGHMIILLKEFINIIQFVYLFTMTKKVVKIVFCRMCSSRKSPTEGLRNSEGEGGLIVENFRRGGGQLNTIIFQRVFWAKNMWLTTSCVSIDFHWSLGFVNGVWGHIFTFSSSCFLCYHQVLAWQQSHVVITIFSLFMVIWSQSGVI